MTIPNSIQVALASVKAESPDAYAAVLMELAFHAQHRSLDSDLVTENPSEKATLAFYESMMCVTVADVIEAHTKVKGN